MENMFKKNIYTALVIGGSKGLGYAVVQQLLCNEYTKIIILDKVKPDLVNSRIHYKYFDLSNDNLDALNEYDNIDTLIITTGIGRLASFDTFSEAEIQKTFQVNTVTIIKIIKYFYNKLISNDLFYCAIVTSIAGVVSSPLFSLYSATKAALYKFIESVNIELEKEGTQNRILNICPGFLNGTSFYGEKTNISLLQNITNDLIKYMKNRETLYIPQYEEIYKEVINEYIENNHQFGLKSHDYKLRSGRINNISSVKIGYLSGTFDLFHIGHLNIIKRAKEHCDYLIVGIHKDASHKGKIAFIPFEERCEIVKNIKYVDRVMESKSEDLDVYDDIKYNYLFVGSDYKGTERFLKYEEYFKDKNVKIIYFPYTNDTNSTKLRDILGKLLKND